MEQGWNKKKTQKQECPRTFSSRGNSPEKSDQEVVNCPLKSPTPHPPMIYPEKDQLLDVLLLSWWKKGFLPEWEWLLSPPHPHNNGKMAFPYIDVGPGGGGGCAALLPCPSSRHLCLYAALLSCCIHGASLHKSIGVFDLFLHQ